MNKRSLQIRYLIFDILAAFIVWMLFMYFRRFVNDYDSLFNVRIFIPNYNFFTSLLLFPLCCIPVHYLSGFYLAPEKHTGTFTFFTTFVTTFIISFAIFFTLLIDDIVVSYEYYYHSLLVLFVLYFVVTYIFRLILYSQVKSNYKKKRWTINTLIIGTGKNAKRIQSELEKQSRRHTLMGFVSCDKSQVVPDDTILGNMKQLKKIINENKIKEVIIALDETDEEQLFSFVNQLYPFNVEIQFIPGLYEILTGKSNINMLGSSPLISVTSLSMPDWQICTKRFTDVFISLSALIILSPIFLYFSILIKIDSRGPVFYRQERIGLHSKKFNILKFRSMYIGSEKGMPRLSSTDDDRITKIGRTLRKYRLDEIPQFWNILKGDMSLVGPRPEREFYIKQIVEVAPYYFLVYKVRPGLTSWGPIKIGYTDTLDKMVERLNFDIIYIENMSLLNDIKILFSTVKVIFKGEGV